MAGIQTLDFDSPDETRTPDKTRVDVVHVGGEKLLAKLGPGVDQDRRPPIAVDDALDQQPAAQAPVLRLVRVAGAPIVADARHARR